MSTSFPPPPSEDPVNPYAAPTAEIGAEPTGLAAVAEAIRRAHIGHEASIKSVGLLHYLSAAIGLLVVVGLIFVLVQVVSRGPADASQMPFLIGIALVYALLSGLNFALGNGLRGLKPWARLTETALMSVVMFIYLIGLITSLVSQEFSVTIVFLVGMLIMGYILYLLLSKKGMIVFSPAYKDIIAQTPHVKYRTSLLAKIVLAIFIAAVVVAILAAVFGSAPVPDETTDVR